MVTLFGKAVVLLFAIICQISFSKMIKSSLGELQDCEKEFQDKCLIECGDLKRILCYCKNYKVAEQTNHKCLCAANASECTKELETFINTFKK